MVSKNSRMGSACTIYTIRSSLPKESGGRKYREMQMVNAFSLRKVSHHAKPEAQDLEAFNSGSELGFF